MLLCSTLLSLALLFFFARTAKAEPVFPSHVNHPDQLLERLQPVLALSEAELLDLIPERAGLFFVGCPNCNGGAQEGQISWSLDKPHEVFCKYCDMRYPNDKFPDTKILEVKNPVGQIQKYPYWEDETGYRYFFRAKGWFLARAFFANAAYDLAKLYHATGDSTFAQRSAFILNRFAEVYPGYCVHHDLPFRQKIIYPGDQDFPYPVTDYRASKWDWWAYMDIPENLIYTYDLIRESDALTAEMKARIENNFFHASLTFVRNYPPALTNMDPTLLRGFIAAGRVLSEPDYIHDTIDRIDRLIEGQFFFDGMWREGAISYHNQTVGGLGQLINRLAGYSDPDGYTHPKDGEHYSNLDLTERFPILQKARKVPVLLRYPNGRVVPTHDTWANEQRDAPNNTGPMLLAAMGHARLDLGKGENQTQTYLHFSGGYGHQHADLLSLTLFARGQERLSDIGYTHTRHRVWTLSTLSHNTVTVNGEDQNFGSMNHPSDGNLLLYVPGDDTFQAIEASGDRAYPDITSTYRRTLIQIGLSPEQNYTVDLFAVSGGNRHEYTLVGDANQDGTLETDLSTTKYGDTLLPPGVQATLPTGESVKGDAEGHNLGYAYIRNVQQTTISSPWTATFTSGGEPKGTVRVHSLTQPDGTLYLAEAPSVRRAAEDDTKLDSITMPVLLYRRDGNNLSTLFATVLEPTSGKAFLDSVERLSLEAGSEHAIALKITSGETTDYILYSPDPQRAVSAAGITLTGRIGFIRERNGRVESQTLVGGTSLEKDGTQLEGSGIFSGDILSTLRKSSEDTVDGLVVDANLPEGDELAGQTVIIHDGAGFTYGHEIAHVIHQDNKTVLVLADDPGFEIDTENNSRLLFFPGRSWTGQNRFEISTTVQK
ncbi:MAG: heparinase II/III family protein [bacterium]|nr:heparinase II/III family protein [bacterium]